MCPVRYGLMMPGIVENVLEMPIRMLANCINNNTHTHTNHDITLIKIMDA